MALDFEPDQPALNFGPRHHARWSSREFLLWPAWAYRVVAPRVRRREFNVLQRAIMGLCRAGVPRVEQIAEHLSVHKDLVGFIVAELSDLGYLDQHGLPTVHGERALEGDAFEAHDMVAGYVFQDPWRGDLWPRFTESLHYCELEFSERGFPSVVLGTTGKPRRYRAFSVLPRNHPSPSTPRAEEVVHAVAQHTRGLRFRGSSDHDEDPIGDFVASGVQISRVSFVEEEPQAVSLLTYLYVPEAPDDAMDWYACDPFGLGQSSLLRRRVEAVMGGDQGLFTVVDQLVGGALHGGYEEQQQWLKRVELKAGLEVEHRLTVEIRGHSAFGQLLDLEAARQEMVALGAGCSDRKIQEVLRAGSKVLEAVFSSIAAEHPLGEVWHRVYNQALDKRTQEVRYTPLRDPQLCSEIYRRAFASLGFKPPIPGGFLSPKPGNVRSVCGRGGHWRLRPLVTATALRAQHDPGHPLARAATQSPELLELLDSIASTGGAAGHAAADSISAEEAEQHVERVYEAVAVLLGLDLTHLEPSQEETGGSHGETKEQQEH